VRRMLTAYASRAAAPTCVHTTQKKKWLSSRTTCFSLVVAENACASERCFAHVCVSQLSVALAW
jgi:hypothetical protein